MGCLLELTSLVWCSQGKRRCRSLPQPREQEYEVVSSGACRDPALESRGSLALNRGSLLALENRGGLALENQGGLALESRGSVALESRGFGRGPALMG